jgi:hypothetical protein
MPVELKVKALSAEEWDYLLGLFLSDGSSDVNEGRNYRVRFALQGNEAQLARKVVELLRRLGLHSTILRDKREDSWTVHAISVCLYHSLPCKKTLNESATARERFFEENRLLTKEAGVPFLAGLIDGDGGCHPTIRVKRNGLPYLEKCWRFSQFKLPFLVDYVEKLMKSVVARSERCVSVRIDPHKGSWSSNPLSIVSFLKPGIDALLAAGIGNYSWKVSRWLKKTGELRSWRGSYLTTPQVAKLLKVDAATVRSWVRIDKLRRALRRGRWFYVPVWEVDRLKKELSKQAPKGF